MKTLENLEVKPDGSINYSGGTTRDKLAESYGMSIRQLMRRIKREGIIIGPGHIITGKQLKQIFEALGPPTFYVPS